MKQTFSAYWHDELEAAVKAACADRTEPFTASLTGAEEIGAVIAAVNQGIDSHLEACYCPERGDRFDHVGRGFHAQGDTPYWKKGQWVVHTSALNCTISNQSLPTLIRRLMESSNDAGESLGRDMCESIGIELV